MDEVRYLNFPISLLSDLITNKENCLYNIYCYALFKHSLDLDYGDDLDKIGCAASYFKVRLTNLEAQDLFYKGEELYCKIPRNEVKVGIRTSIFLDYYFNYKSEFQLVSLLGFLAIKSILQNKAYCKITNVYWLSRMSGKSKSVKSFFELSELILKYSSEYQTKRIKQELILNWGLVHYARYTRGFYVSFKLDLDSLTYEVEKKRKSRKLKVLRKQQDEALAKALNRLDNE